MGRINETHTIVIIAAADWWALLSCRFGNFPYYKKKKRKGRKEGGKEGEREGGSSPFKAIRDAIAVSLKMASSQEHFWWWTENSSRKNDNDIDNDICAEVGQATLSGMDREGATGIHQILSTAALMNATGSLQVLSQSGAGPRCP